MRSGRAGPSFSVRPEKEAKGAFKSTALRQREALMHVETCSARRPKTRRLTALKQFGRSFDRFAVKSPHEPRRQTLQMLPRPSASVLRCI